MSTAKTAEGNHVGEERFKRGSVEAAADSTKRFARKSLEVVGDVILGATTFNASMEQAAPHNPEAVATAKAELAAEKKHRAEEKKAHPSAVSKVAHAIKDAVLGAVVFEHPKMYSGEEHKEPTKHKPAPSEAANDHAGEARFKRGSVEAAADSTKRFARKSLEAVGNVILGATTFNASMEQAAPHNPGAVAAAKAELAAEQAAKHEEKLAHPSTTSKVAHAVKDAVLGAVTFDHPKMYASEEPKTTST